MQVSYHKAIIEDCDYKIIMFYLYVYILGFQFWYMQCALTHEVSRHKDGDRAGGGSDKEECADGIQCRQSMVPFWSVFEVHPLYQFCCKR